MKSFQMLAQTQIKYSRVLLFVLFISFSFGLNSQTSEQAKNFLNRSHVSIMKAQKEMMKSAQKTYEAQLKEAIKYQSVAVKLYDQNKLKEAVNYSYRSRAIIMPVINKLSPAAVNGLSFSEDEKNISNQSENEKLQIGSLLTKTESEQVDQLDVLDYQKLRAIILNAK